VKQKFDSLPLGAVLGLISPILAMFGYYLYFYSYMTIRGFIHFLQLGNIYTPLLSLSVVINLLVFFIFIWTDRLFSARGVLLATFIYAGIVVYLKIKSSGL